MNQFSESMSSPSRLSKVAAGASWMALVAASYVGAENFDSVRAHVTADPATEVTPAARYRLVVQAYAPGSVTQGSLPSAASRPLASAQRAVSADELRAGVAIDVMQLGGEFRAVADPTVVAWVEPGDADLDYQGLRARPGPEALCGAAEHAHAGSVDLVLAHSGSLGVA
jgi:hypothetical protein